MFKSLKNLAQMVDFIQPLIEQICVFLWPSHFSSNHSPLAKRRKNIPDRWIKIALVDTLKVCYSSTNHIFKTVSFSSTKWWNNLTKVTTTVLHFLMQQDVRLKPEEDKLFGFVMGSLVERYNLDFNILVLFGKWIFPS